MPPKSLNSDQGLNSALLYLPFYIDPPASDIGQNKFGLSFIMNLRSYSHQLAITAWHKAITIRKIPQTFTVMGAGRPSFLCITVTA